jgi:hypothetical protein
MKRLWLRVLAASFAILLLPGQTLATDNLAFTWLPQQWSIYDYSPCIIYQSSVPTGSIRDRASEARGKWNSVNTELWIGIRTPCSYQTMKTIIVKYEDLWVPNNDDWAFVTCNPPGVTTCALNINKSPDVAGFQSWYWGTGTPGSGQVDGLSVLTHEFGHCVTLWHTTQSSSDVMYPYLNLGQTRRNLTTHDKNSIKAMYHYPAT